MSLLRTLAPLLLLAPLLTGCGGGSDDGKPSVVASFYPLWYVAERVVGEHATVTNLTSPGVEPHDLELNVPKTAEIADSDVAIYEKGLQPAVDDAIEQNGPEHVLETTRAVPLDHGDPHFWLDPARLSKVAAAFETEMTKVDPDHKADYARNLQGLQRDLSRLDDEYDAGLSDCKLDTVVVSHDAFHYMGKYGVRFQAINGLSPDAEPSPAHIAKLQDVIKSDGITTVFAEALGTRKMADSIASDLGIHTAVLDPIEGLTDSTAHQDYLSLMRKNLAALRQANQCQ